MTNRVILYSGGLDSFAGYHLLNKRNPGEWTKAYFQLGTRYGAKEANTLPGDVYFSDNLRLGEFERSDAFVPQRNVLLVTLAQAIYSADEIALCGVKGEYSRDKHPKFYRQMSEILSYTAGKSVRVFSPFEKMTKSQAVRTLLEPDGRIRPELIAGIMETTSCYDPRSRACGQCMSCFRRWVALENNGLAHLTEWDNPPWRSEFASAASLRKLPFGMLPDFTRAQLDVATAYWKLWRRTGEKPFA